MDDGLVFRVVGSHTIHHRHPLQGINDQVVARSLVHHGQVEGCRGGALLYVPVHAEATCGGTPTVEETVHGLRRPMVEEDDGRLRSEDAFKLTFGQGTGVHAWERQREEVHDVHHTGAQDWQALAQPVHSRHCLERRHVASARKDDVDAPILSACPRPDASTLRHMCLGIAQTQPLWHRVLSSDYQVHLVARLQAIPRDCQQCVRVRRKEHICDRWFGHDVVDEARALVRVSVVVLAPSVRRQDVVQRRDSLPPW
mmetsp:Transcript_51662/g.137898  ORF Transcript_51662/g.137898 Transcript_51662/m.137898 type:complete len:255 (+) Transcript_51662:426-1190(+)